jgi:single-strand DNA-binding protein
MNNVNLFGRLTKDIELKYAQNEKGTAIGRFTVAVNRDVPNAKGEREADFIPCVSFGKTAEFISKYFHKGTRIIVSGRIQTGSYQDQQGQTRYTTEVVVNQAYFVETAAESGNKQAAQQAPQGQQQAQYQQPQGQPVQQYQQPMQQFQQAPQGQPVQQFQQAPMQQYQQPQGQQFQQPVQQVPQGQAQFQGMNPPVQQAPQGQPVQSSGNDEIPMMDGIEFPFS